MNNPFQHSLIEQHWASTDEVLITPLSNGLINETWVVLNKNHKEQLLLQKVNTAIFKDPELISNNHLLLWNEWNKQKDKLNFQLAKPLPFSNGSFIYYDQSGVAWRLQEYFSIAVTHTQSISIEQLYETAFSFGQFNDFLWKISPATIQSPLERFHDLTFRFWQFNQALQSATNPTRIHKAKGLIDKAIAKKRYVEQFDQLAGNPNHFPKRILHHDAKIANLLFEKDQLKVYAIIDLDTVMPGYFFSDLGDMIRSMGSIANENETNFENVSINPTHYEALLEGYLKAVKNSLTPEELKWIHSSGIWIIYMQALRFLSDYLQNDTYYKTNYQEHNFDRALNQFTLLESLEKILLQVYHYEHVVN